MKKSALTLSAAAAFALLLVASPAGAVTLTITLSEDGGPAFTAATATDTIASYTGAFGDFTANNISATGSPPNAANDLLSSTALNVSGTGGHSLTIDITASNIIAPLGNFNFLSSFTSNTLPSGWTVVETTFLNGVQLSSDTFNSIGTAVLSTLASTGNAPYSVMERYILTATTANTALSTIDLTVSPVPIPGALPLFASGLLGLWALGRKRRKSKLESAIA